MATSFKRPQACTAALSALDPAAGDHQPMPLLETPDTHRQVWVSLLWGSLFLSCCLTGEQTMVEVMKVMTTSFKRSRAHTAALSSPEPEADQS